MCKITVLLLALFATAAFGAPKGALENPQPNDYASGIYLFSGWVCEAETVQIGLDGVQLLDVAYGSDRLDTHDECGDADNGFGLTNPTRKEVYPARVIVGLRILQSPLRSSKCRISE